MDYLRLGSSNPFMALFPPRSFLSPFTRGLLIRGFHPGGDGRVVLRMNGKARPKFLYFSIKLKELLYGGLFTRPI